MANGSTTVKVEAADLPQVRVALREMVDTIDELTDQRDQARRIAASLEAECAEKDQRIEAARAILDGEPEVVRWIDGQRLVDRDVLIAALADPS
jgi:hypothetical protein